MKKEFIFAGCRAKVSKAGKAYGDIYLFDKLADGSADFEQLKFRTFDELVLSSCKMIKPGDSIEVDLWIRDALVQGVELNVEI